MSVRCNRTALHRRVRGRTPPVALLRCGASRVRCVGELGAVAQCRLQWRSAGCSGAVPAAHLAVDHDGRAARLHDRVGHRRARVPRDHLPKARHSHRCRRVTRAGAPLPRRAPSCNTIHSRNSLHSRNALAQSCRVGHALGWIHCRAHHHLLRVAHAERLHRRVERGGARLHGEAVPAHSHTAYTGYSRTPVRYSRTPVRYTLHGEPVPDPAQRGYKTAPGFCTEPALAPTVAAGTGGATTQGGAAAQRPAAAGSAACMCAAMAVCARARVWVCVCVCVCV